MRDDERVTPTDRQAARNFLEMGLRYLEFDDLAAVRECCLLADAALKKAQEER